MGSPLDHMRHLACGRHLGQAAADDRQLRLLRTQVPARGLARRLHLQDRAARHPEVDRQQPGHRRHLRSEEHTSELQSLMRISYAVLCLKKTNKINNTKSSTSYK